MDIPSYFYFGFYSPKFINFINFLLRELLYFKFILVKIVVYYKYLIGYSCINR